MNIIEAIKSGKKFRRRGSHSWMKAPSDDVLITYVDSGNCFNPTINDILAEDFELEEKKVEITYAQLKEAFERRCPPTWQLDAIAKELGLIE